MKWDIVAEVTLFVTSLFAMGLTAATLIKTVKGSRYKLAIQVMSLLLAANFAYFLTSIATIFQLKALFRDMTSSILFWANSTAILQSIGDLFFCEGHWILAHLFFRVAKNTPRMLKGGKPFDYNLSFWIGVVANAVIPLCEAIFLPVENDFFYKNDNHVPKVIYACVVVSIAATGILQVISGGILNWSIWRIRSIIKNQHFEFEEMDIPMLLIHASAFLFFMISAAIYYSFSVINWLDPDTKTFKESNAAWTFQLICSFISQLLLCVIFWRLSPEEEEEVEEETDTKSRKSKSAMSPANSFRSIRVQSFDEDAEL